MLSVEVVGQESYQLLVCSCSVLIKGGKVNTPPFGTNLYCL